MFKVCLPILLLFSNMFPALQEYKVSIQNSRTYVNDSEVFCDCGKPPISIVFLSGHFEYYCASHIPEIEYVRPIKLEDIERLLESINVKQ